MERRRDGSIRRALSTALLLVAAVGVAAQEAPDRRTLATRFARLFMDGADEQAAAMMAEPVRAAMAGDRAAQLRSDLAERFGELQGVDEAWAEDLFQGYHRFRAPVRFAGETVDLRVVLDGEGLVVGLFVVPHLEPQEPGDDGEAVTIGSGERGLPGTLLLPDGPGPFPGVVLVHGSGAQDRDETIGPNKPFRDLARGLSQRGVATLRYDKRSYVRPGDLAELGDALTVEQEVVEDARAALELLRRHDAVDTGRVYLLGHSLGGAVAPRIAAVEPRPAGMIVMAGMALPLPEKIVDQMRYIAGLDDEMSTEEREQLQQIETLMANLRKALDGKTPAPEGAVLGAPIGYYADLEAHDPPAEAAALGLPVLVLQGERDYQVTMDDFSLWQAALKGKPHACLATFEQMDHLFRTGAGRSSPADYERPEPMDEGVIDVVASWILDRSCPG